MKKINSLLIILIGIQYSIHCQTVGINTANPQTGILHIDGKGDNNIAGSPSAIQVMNDIFINSNGSVAIGHSTPTKKLDITSRQQGITQPHSALQIEDGSQMEYKVLTSDANGIATWKFPGELDCTQGVLPKIGLTTSLPITTPKYLGAYITLPVGTWAVFINLVSETDSNSNNYAIADWLNLIFANSPSSDKASADNITGYFTADYLYPNTPTLFNGTHIIRNQSAGNKTYYLWTHNYILHGIAPNTKIVNFGSSDYPQNRIVALRIK